MISLIAEIEEGAYDAAVEQETLFAELDQLLEPEIEAHLRSGIYGEKKRPLVQLYLDQKALGRAQPAQAGQTREHEAQRMRHGSPLSHPSLHRPRPLVRRPHSAPRSPIIGSGCVSLQSERIASTRRLASRTASS